MTYRGYLREASVDHCLSPLVLIRQPKEHATDKNVRHP